MWQELYIDSCVYSSPHEMKKPRPYYRNYITCLRTQSANGLLDLGIWLVPSTQYTWFSQFWAGSAPNLCSRGPGAITITITAWGVSPSARSDFAGHWWMAVETWTHSWSSENQPQDENFRAGRDLTKHTATLEFCRWEHWGQRIRINWSAKVKRFSDSGTKTHFPA